MGRRCGLCGEAIEQDDSSCKEDHTWEYTTLEVGHDLVMELRRFNDHYQFRPKHIDDPTNFLQVQMNVELKYAGKAWVPVPDHLLYQAKGAFK